MNGKLTIKQQMFVNEYLIDLNATQAAIRAGYSKRTAKEIGCENLTKPHIQAAISGAMDERSKRTGITADRVLEDLAKIAFADIRDIFTSEGHLRSIDTLSDSIAGAIQHIEVTYRNTGTTDVEGNRVVEQVHKIRLGDKLRALELLGRHLGLFDQNKNAPDGIFNILMDFGDGKGQQQFGNYVAESD